MKTRQTIFNNGIRQIAKHGYGMDGTSCAYRVNGRASDKIRCAIGASIPNNKYNVDLEGKAADSYLVREAAGITPEDGLFAQRFQSLHDNAAREELAIDLFMIKAADFAMQEGLKWTPVPPSA